MHEVVQGVKPESRTTPQPTMTLLILEKLKYQDERDRLTQLYIELLKRACDKDREKEAHPAFANIITQLSGDEALVLYFLKLGGATGRYLLSARRGAANESLNHLIYRDIDQPKSLKKGYTFKSSAVVSNIFPLELVNAPDYMNIYISHLRSLNLVSVMKSPGTIAFYASEDDADKNKLQTKDLVRYTLSPFGDLFARACIPDNYIVGDLS